MVKVNNTSEPSCRSFVIDYGCCLPFGHNLECVKLYKSMEEAKGNTATGVVCRRIANYIKPDPHIRTVLPALYSSLIINSEERWFLRNIYRVFHTFLELINGLVYRISDRSTSVSLFLARRAMRGLIRRENVGGQDKIVMPSAEYFGTMALLDQLRRIPPSERPRVELRFIGVLENSNNIHTDTLHDLSQRMHEFGAEELKITAEVPRYAHLLQEIFYGRKINPEPYPAVSKRFRELPDKPTKSLKIILPGSNRIDKGYLSLYTLFKNLAYLHPEVSFVVQDMKPWDKHFRKSYRAKLATLPNVQLLEAILSREKIEEMYDSADAVLLPYDPLTYLFRGSAIHYESVVRGIPVIARKGCGFEDEVVSWGSGWLYETLGDISNTIRQLQQINRENLHLQLVAAKDAFLGNKR